MWTRRTANPLRSRSASSRHSTRMRRSRTRATSSIGIWPITRGAEGSVAVTNDLLRLCEDDLVVRGVKQARGRAFAARPPPTTLGWRRTRRLSFRSGENLNQVSTSSTIIAAPRPRYCPVADVA
jgi:hypothetical protein